MLCNFYEIMKLIATKELIPNWLTKIPAPIYTKHEFGHS